MKAIVTGGLGFIGSHVVDLLIEKGVEVVVIDNLTTGQWENANSKAKYIIKDILEVEVDIFRDCELVFHLAALPRIQPSFDDPLGHERANVIAVINLLLMLRDNKRLRKFIFSSSSAIYGNPTELPTSEECRPNPLSPYALQKYAAEQYCLMLGERFGINVVALRYFNAYGPRSFNPKNPYNAYSSVVGIFAEQVKAGLPLTITGDGLQTRDFVHVSDVARANWLSALSEVRGEIYNVGSATHISILDLAQKFQHPYIFIPERKGEARTTWADIRKIQRDLGWKPEIHIDQGIQEICEG